MIEVATVWDIDDIISVAKASWRIAYKDILSDEQFTYMMNRFYSHEILETSISAKTQTFILYKDKQRVKGFASYQIDYPEIGIIKIHKLYILPEAQGLGIGKSLLLRIKEIARESGMKVLQLNVNKFNKAKLFYENVGFSVAYPEVIDIGNNYVMDDYVMKMHL